MKKILLSCACCLLALGLVTACDNEEEEPNEPEVPGTVVDDGGSELATIKSGKLGLLYEENYHYLYFTGEVTDGFKGTLSEDWNDGVNVTLAGTADSCYLSFEQNGSTVYVGGYTEGNYFDMDVESTPYELKYDSTNDAILTTDGKYYLGAYNGEYLRWMSSTYLGNEGDYTAHIYSSAQTSPTAPELPDPAEWQVGESYLFGVNLTSEIQYIDGTTVGSYTYEGTLTSNASKAVHVTVGEAGESGDNAYTLSFVLSGETYYITIVTTGEGDDTHTNLSYSTEEALIYWNETYGCWGNEEETHFLCYNSAYKCLYCSEIESWIGSSPIAALYDLQPLPAPTTMSITGDDFVFAGFTTQLGVEVDEGADASVTWEIALPSEATAGDVVSTYASIDQNGVVTGIATYEGLVVTATSAVEGCTVSATATINVLEVNLPSADATTYKLGAIDKTNYKYVWFSGETTGSTFLATTDSWCSAAEVYITEQTWGDSETACTIALKQDDNTYKYIANHSSTSVLIEETPCIWVYDETYSVFAMGTNLGVTSGGDRFLCYYATTPSFRAYAGTTSNLNSYPHVTAYTSEPEAMEKPAPAYDMTLVTSLQSGSEYYLAYFNESTGTYYFFDGNKVGSNDYYLSCSTDIESAAKVTVTSADSDKWTLTFGEEGSINTLEGWVNDSNGSTHAEITYYQGTSTHSGVTSFNWNSEYNTVTITLNSTEYYLEYYLYTSSGNSTNEIQLNGISYISSTGNAFQLFTLNESDPD